MVEELAKADGENEVTKESVIDTGKKEGAGVLVGEGEEEAADNTKNYGHPVAEDDVDEAKGAGACEKHSPARTEKRLVAMEEKGAIEEFLRVNGQERVKKHDQSPKGRGALDEREKKLRSKDADGEAQQDQENRVSQEKPREIRSDAAEREELWRIEGGIVPQEEKGGQACDQQIQNREIGNHTIENEQRNAEKDKTELEGEQKQFWHGTANRMYQEAGLLSTSTEAGEEF